MPLSDDQLITLVRRDNLLSPEKVREAREASRKTGKPLLDVIRERRWLDDAEMAHVEAAAALVLPPGYDTGASQTAIGTAEQFAGLASNRPTAVPQARGSDETVFANPGNPAVTPLPRPEPAAVPPEPVAAKNSVGTTLIVIATMALVAAVVYGGLVYLKGKGGRTAEQPPAPTTPPSAAPDWLREFDDHFHKAAIACQEARMATADGPLSRAFAGFSTEMTAALKIASKAAKANPSPEAWLARGRAERALGDPDAVSSLSKSSLPQAHAELAAANACLALESLYPPGAVGVEALGPGFVPTLPQQARGLLQEAKSQLEAAGAAGGKLPAASAAIALADGHVDEAAATSGDALGDPDALYVSALASLFKGAFDEATRSFDVLYRLQPALLRSRLQRVLPLLATNPALAEQPANEAWSQSRNDPRACALLADALLRAKGAAGTKRALDLLDGLGELEKRPAHLMLKARALALKGDASATELAQKAIDRSERDQYFRYAAACVNLDLGQGDEGKRRLGELVKEYPKLPIAAAARRKLGQ